MHDLVMTEKRCPQVVLLVCTAGLLYINAATIFSETWIAAQILYEYRAVDKVGFGVNTQLKLAKYPIIFKNGGNKTQLKQQNTKLVQNGLAPQNSNVTKMEHSTINFAIYYRVVVTKTCQFD